MSRFVRQSAYRHVYGNQQKQGYQNIKVSASAFDTDLISASSKFIAVNYQSGGGGAFVVVPLDKPGKLPDIYPLARAHSAPVLDTDWSPFDDYLVASGGEDGKIAITRVDPDILEAPWVDGGNIQDLEAVSKGKMGHGRKVGHVMFHPTAQNLLASASSEVKLWDIEANQCHFESEMQPDIVQDLSFSYTGDIVATTCKDKKLRLFDVRGKPAAVLTVESHAGIKGSRVAWMGDRDRLATTGFSKMSDRQIFIWDHRKMDKPTKTVTVDTASGTLMPFWSDNNILFVAGKGDGNIRYYESEGDELYPLSEFKSSDPQRGMTFGPRRALNVSECEIMKCYKVTGSQVDAISFIVPRKSDAFQSDIYPPAQSDKPALSASEFLGGQTKNPILINLDSKEVTASTPAKSTPIPSRTATAEAPKPTQAPTETVSRQASFTAPPAPSPAPAPVAVSTPPVRSESPAPVAAPGSSIASDGEVEELRKQVERLGEELKERDSLIRTLELQVESYRAAVQKAQNALNL